jgi:hypothetical protein
LPAVAVPDGTHLLDVLHLYIRAGFVLQEDEVRPLLLQVEALGEAELTVLVVVFDAFLLPRDGRARVAVATLPVAGWVVAVVGVVPAGERFSKFFENSLCSKIEDFWHHENRRFSNELD